MLGILVASISNAQHGTFGDYQVIDADFRNEVDTFNSNTYDWSWAQDQITFDPRNNPAHRSDFTSNSINRFEQSGTISITVTSVVTEGDFTNYKWGTRTEPTSALYLNRDELVRDAQIHVDAVAGREVFIWEISDRIYTASAGTTTFTFDRNTIAEDLNHFEGTRIHHDAQDEIGFEFRFSSVVASTVPNFTQADWDNALSDPTFEFDFPSQYDDHSSVNVIRQAVRIRRGHLDDTSTRTPLQDVAMTESIANSNYESAVGCEDNSDNYHRWFIDFQTRLANSATNIGSLSIVDQDLEYTFISPTDVSYTILFSGTSISAQTTIEGSGGINIISFCANEITEWLEERD